jgi:hypothetical protein
VIKHEDMQYCRLRSQDEVFKEFANSLREHLHGIKVSVRGIYEGEDKAVEY